MPWKSMENLVVYRGRLMVAAALVCFALATGCRRDLLQLDPVQRMAYTVKPAVVRVSAYSTAQFRYPAAAIRELERELRLEGFNISASDVPQGAGSIETGAGGSGSGFIIHPTGYILTSGHVIAATTDRERMQADLLHNGAIAALLDHFPVETLRALYRSNRLNGYIQQLARAGSLAEVRTFNEVELSNGQKLPFARREYSPSLSQNGHDLALLKISRNELPTLQLANSDAVHLQEQIWVVGYPAVASSTDEIIGGWLSRDSDLEATVNPGSITAIKRNVLNVPVFQTDVGIYHGNSGGPAVNRDGKVVGIATWGHTDAEQIKFLVPINQARQLLGRAKVPVNVEGNFNVSYRRALDKAHAGDWTEAKKSLLQADTLFPHSPDLIRFMNDADLAIRSLPFWQIHPIVTSAAAALLLFGATAAIAVSQRRRLPLGVPSEALRETFVSPAPRSGTLPGAVRRATSALGKFTILNGDRAGERLGLGGSGIRIGRESTICEIVLQDPKVSRLHAEVVSIDGKVLLIDRNSSNGTYVNDQKIDRQFLKDGDIIYFGGRNAVAVAFHS
jgi:S1-C subfamily serine protease